MGYCLQIKRGVNQMTQMTIRKDSSYYKPNIVICVIYIKMVSWQGCKTRFVFYYGIS